MILSAKAGKMASHAPTAGEQTSILGITLAPSIHDFMSKLTLPSAIYLIKKHREETMERKLDFDNF